MITVHLRELMAKKKIDSQKQLMSESQLSRNALTRLYKEVELEGLKLETLIKLCNYFNCKLSELIEYTPD